jgi:hypothetical protein
MTLRECPERYKKYALSENFSLERFDLVNFSESGM